MFTLVSCQASHLLVKHRDSRRPASWRSDNITRSKEEALEILEGYEKQVSLRVDHFLSLSVTITVAF